MNAPVTDIRPKGAPVDTALLEDVLLPQVNKPGRYLGLEQGAFRKPFEQAEVTMAFAFPDIYEIGLSHYGMKLLYSVVNAQAGMLCDRVYAPADDMKAALAACEVPLFAVESRVPLRDFDALAFSLQYELNATGILGILDAAQIPFRSGDRPTWEDGPLLLAGGPGCGNPMPMAPFFDAFILGDGEDVLVEILDAIRQGKRLGLAKPALLAQLAAIRGVFVPGLSTRAEKRLVDIATFQVAIAPLIPTVAAVHDRVVVEARRGCDRMCRFCQPCFINLPVREQSIDTITKKALHELAQTGYDECSLLSLSIADYSQFRNLAVSVADALADQGVSLSLPSQRADRFSVEVAEAVQSVRKSTLTFAPEAGTARLRDVINKNLSDDEILSAVMTAYEAGWNKVKLYFMIGLPTETPADLDGIVDLVQRLKIACKAIQRDPARSIRHQLELNLTFSNFVPKPHTPFQWVPQASMVELREKIAYLRQAFGKTPGVKLSFTDPELSKLEAVIAKGDTRMADVIEGAYRRGVYLDSWDSAGFAQWFAALEEAGIDPEAATRQWLTTPGDPLPWAPMDMGLDPLWLQAEYERAMAAASTTPCFETCSACGVCPTFATWPSFAAAPAATALSGETRRFRARPTRRSEAMTLPPVIKLRLMVEKRGAMRFISHLDWLRLWHRVVLRAGLPVAYSQGFNPKPKIAFSPALPMFCEGLAEWIDIDLTTPDAQAMAALNRYLPQGGQVLQQALLPLRTPSIEPSIRQWNYTARWACQDDAKRVTIQERVRYLAAQQTLLIDRSAFGKTPASSEPLDIAPYLVSLDVSAIDPQVQVSFSLACPPGGKRTLIKPVWLLTLLDPDARWALTRTSIEL